MTWASGPMVEDGQPVPRAVLDHLAGPRAPLPRSSTIRQWCPACQKATKTITLSNERSVCAECWEEPTDDDY